jgi:hypothetical protein
MNHQLRIPRGLDVLPLLAQLYVGVFVSVSRSRSMLTESATLGYRDLSGNEFDGQADASLLSSSLTSLYLDNCQLKARPTHIERLQRLQTLYVRAVRVVLYSVRLDVNGICNRSLKNNPLVGEFPVGGLSVMTTL